MPSASLAVLLRLQLDVVDCRLEGGQRPSVDSENQWQRLRVK